MGRERLRTRSVGRDVWGVCDEGGAGGRADLASSGGATERSAPPQRTSKETLKSKDA